MSDIIVPDNPDSLNVGGKIDTKNTFTFLASLDYIKQLEESNVFEYFDTKSLYLTNEKQKVLTFVMSHFSFWALMFYLVGLSVGTFIFMYNPIYIVVAISILWMLFSFWFVNRYTIGNGILWAVVRDFMITATFLTFFISLALDITIFIVIPYFLDIANNWLTSGSKEGILNQWAVDVVSFTVAIFEPLIQTLTAKSKSILYAYSMVGVLKFLSFFIPTIYMFYLHNKRKYLKKVLNEKLKKLA